MGLLLIAMVASQLTATIRAMPDDRQQPVPVSEPVEIPLPAYLRPLLPHMRLRGWLMPLVFALLALVFWEYGHSQLDWTPWRRIFAAWCFAAVSLFFVFARLWVGWRVRRGDEEVPGMSTRLKRTLVSAARGAAVVFVLAALQMSRGASLAEVVPWAVGFAVIFAVITWYTWWFYGDSPKALALQAKVEAKKTQRLG